jgi:cation transport protein ChaC
MQEFWVFGYGSLMWHPGFEYAQRSRARLDGYARRFCMRSIHYRGTSEAPGLVLALDAQEGAVCDGVAFRVAGARAEETLAYLRERELISYAYLEKRLPVLLPDGGRVEALCYVIDPAHDQYCGGVPLQQQADIIAMAAGARGPNAEYLDNTVQHLRELGVHDPELEWLQNTVAAKAATNRL